MCLGNPRGLDASADSGEHTGQVKVVGFDEETAMPNTQTLRELKELSSLLRDKAVRKRQNSYGEP